MPRQSQRVRELEAAEAEMEEALPLCATWCGREFHLFITEVFGAGTDRYSCFWGTLR